MYAAEALARIGGKDAIEELVALAEDEDESRGIRCFVLDCLGLTHSRDCLPVLIEYVEHWDYPYRLHAVAAMGELGFPDLAPGIELLLSDAEVNVRLAAAATLVRLGQQERLAILYGALKSSDALVRLEALKNLSSVGLPSTLTSVAPLCQDSDAAVRKVAERVMAEVGGR